MSLGGQAQERYRATAISASRGLALPEACDQGCDVISHGPQDCVGPSSGHALARPASVVNRYTAAEEFERSLRAQREGLTNDGAVSYGGGVALSLSRRVAVLKLQVGDGGSFRKWY